MSQIPETANKGLENIIACTTQVSAIHDTTLLYRGYSIEDLAEHCCFEEVIYLLWEGKLPNKKELEDFCTHLKQKAFIPKNFIQPLQSIAHMSSHPMAKLRTAISYFGLLDPQADKNDSLYEKAVALTAAIGPIVAALSRYAESKSLIDFDVKHSMAWNILNMLRGTPPTLEEQRIFDTALILHADHELNASAFTARVVVSTNSDYYSAITAALGSLKGPLHGGANEQVMLMLREIGGYHKIDEFIEDALAARKKVMGIGHRVYKNGDPRAKILKRLSKSLCEKKGLKDFYQMLTHIEEQMETKKGLMPNVDFYSGLVYTALDLKPNDFTPIFAMSRITGWTAQIMEQIANNRIYRPRGYYTGPIDLRVENPLKRA